MKANRHPSTTQPIPSDKPLIAREELERSIKSLVRSQLPEDERIALNERWGYPTRPLKNHSNGYYVQRGS